MNPTFRSPNSPGRQVPPAPRYPRPPSDDEEEDDSDEDELVRPGSSGSDASSNVTTVSAAPITPINTQLPPGGYFPPQPRSATSPHHPMPNPPAGVLQSSYPGTDHGITHRGSLSLPCRPPPPTRSLPCQLPVSPRRQQCSRQKGHKTL